MANWASIADVLAYTGATVTDAQISQAQAVIDIFSGTQIESLANQTVRDLRLLKMATAYQTVWQIAQVDVNSRTDVKQLDQDGVKFTPAGPDSLLLAPLAQRCLDRLSWRRSRSVRVGLDQDRFATVAAYGEAWRRDETEAGPDWRPL